MHDLTNPTIQFVVVPLVMAVVVIVIAKGYLDNLRTTRKLQRGGVTVQGRVITSQVRRHARMDHRPDDVWRIETIEYPDPAGHPVRATPAASDVGMLDRTRSGRRPPRPTPPPSCELEHMNR